MNIAKMCHPRGVLFALNCMQMIEYWELPAVPGRASLEAAWRHPMPCARTTVSISRLFHRKSSKGARCSLAFSIFLSAVLQVWWHTPCTRAVSKFCASHIVSEDASSWGDLSSFELFEEADFSPSQHDGRQSPPASAERGQCSDLQESLARGQTDASWVRVHLTCPSPSLLQGPAQFHGSSFEKGQAQKPLDTWFLGYLLTSAVQLLASSPVKSLPFSPLAGRAQFQQLLLIFNRHLSLNNLETNFWNKWLITVVLLISVPFVASSYC